MKMRSIVLLIALNLSAYAVTEASRGSIISADGAVIAKEGTDNGSMGRIYPYGNLLSPVIGHTQIKTSNGAAKLQGVGGLEIYFNEVLSPMQTRTQKSVQSVMGDNLKLTISLALQKRIESIADRSKKVLKADEVLAFVMESRSGKMLSIASSNRYDPSKATPEKNESLQINAVSYSHEPGTIIKPLIFSLLLQKGMVNPTEIIDGHNGKYLLGKKTIVDEHPFKSLSAEDVIVYSSNIGIAQLAQRLNSYEIVRGLERYGFAHFSGVDLPYERRGSVPSTQKLDHYLYKAIVSYGYGTSANPIQLLAAYNVFNNNGRLINPKVADVFISSDKKITPVHPHRDPIQTISPSSAAQMKKILIKTVTDGTGSNAKTLGLEIGGKTGTVHIAKDGKYIDAYDTSFYGFANDANHAYTIGVIVREPRINYYPSMTAVPVFKEILDVMVEKRYLKPQEK
jgi:cell division protein FtsI (penicillin-binding protein 3)